MREPCAQFFDKRGGLLHRNLDRTNGETARDRTRLIVARYSQWFDEANRALGPVLTSLAATGPQAPSDARCRQ